MSSSTNFVWHCEGLKDFYASHKQISENMQVIVEL